MRGLHESIVGDEPEKARRGTGEFQSVGGADAGQLFGDDCYEDDLFMQNVIVLCVDQKGNWNCVRIADEINSRSWHKC